MNGQADLSGLPEQLIKLLSDWAIAQRIWQHFRRVLLFGSLLRRDGEQFRPFSSDIDLLFEFSSLTDSPHGRRDALLAVLTQIPMLEAELRKRFPDRAGRSIVSAGATTPEENELGIDIGGDPGFTLNSDFLDLLRPELSAVPLGVGMSQQTEARYAEVAVLRECQKYRKHLLAVAVTGEHADGHASSDLMPKDIARLTARLRVIPRDPSERVHNALRDDGAYDVLRGASDFLSLLKDLAAHDRSLGPLADLLELRQSRPTHAPPISSDDILLMWEVLAQKALERIRAHREPKTVDDVLLDIYPPPDQRNNLNQAKSMWITGLNLRRFYPHSDGYIQDVLKRGGKLNALLLSANSDAVKFAAQQDYGPKADIERYVQDLKQAHQWLILLRKAYPYRVQIRTVDFPLTFGLDAFDLETPRGTIYVLYYPIFSQRGDQPVVVLRPQQENWFGFYHEQLTKQWTLFGALYHLAWNVRVDRATIDDVPAVYALAKQLSPERIGQRATENGFILPYSEQRYRSLAEEANHFYVVRAGQRLIGFIVAHTDERADLFFEHEVYLHIKERFPSPCVVVQQICFHPDFAGKGYARRLYDFLVAWSDLDVERYPTAVGFIWKSPLSNRKSEEVHAAMGGQQLMPPFTLSDGRVAGIWYKQIGHSGGVQVPYSPDTPDLRGDR